MAYTGILRATTKDTISIFSIFQREKADHILLPSQCSHTKNFTQALSQAYLSPSAVSRARSPPRPEIIQFFAVDHPRVFFIIIAHEKNRKGRYSRKAGYFWWRKDILKR